MDFEIAYMNKEITPWGGMVLLRKMLEKIRFSQAIEPCDDLPLPVPNRGYKPLSVIESFMVSILVRTFRRTMENIHFGWHYIENEENGSRDFGLLQKA